MDGPVLKQGDLKREFPFVFMIGHMDTIPLDSESLTCNMVEHTWSWDFYSFTVEVKKFPFLLKFYGKHLLHLSCKYAVIYAAILQACKQVTKGS